MLESDGFEIFSGILSNDATRSLLDALSKMDVPGAVRTRAGSSYAVRNLLNAVTAVRALADTPEIRSLIHPVLGSHARPVRGILFDKTPDANWKVPWHQDLSIAVKEKREIVGYGPWSVKAGIPHVQPPVEVLEQVLTLRLHLDSCGDDNGPLRVIPGSHCHGVLSPDEIESMPRSTPSVVCRVSAGGAMLMRPLILHASSPATCPDHRRVIHIEYAAGPLVDGLEWHES